MIPIPSGVRVWIATGHTDMRRGMQGLALQVQESTTDVAAHKGGMSEEKCGGPRILGHHKSLKL